MLGMGGSGSGGGGGVGLLQGDIPERARKLAHSLSPKLHYQVN